MLNKVIVMGRLTKDAELRHTQSNTAVATISLAVGRDFVKEGQQDVDFFDVIAWGKTAEFVSKYFAKGNQIAVVGRLQSRSWEDKNGNKRVSIEINAESVDFCGSKQDNDKSRESKVEDFNDDDFDDVEDNGDLPF